jgi:cobalamin biosynthetic protein CobC
MNETTLEHGGEVDAIADRFRIPRDRWLDLSTGINPNPYPLPELAREYWHRLPDAALDAWLREAAASYYGAPEPACVVPGPGSQAIIQWLPRLVPSLRAAVIGPTYAEHAASWRAAGHRVVEIDRLDDVPADAGAVIVGNPNNPDGRMLDPGRLLHLADERLLVADEAFADIAPDISLSGHARHSNVVVLRSFGKFFGLAGMRLGFALLGETMATRLRRALGPWAVSGPAAAVGAVALADDLWVRSARVRLTAAAGRLDGLLLRAGLQIVGGTSLFRLVEHDRAQDLFELLAGSAILVRRFSRWPTWLRFGIPGDDAAFERLGEALAAWRPQPASPGGSVATAARVRAGGRPPGRGVA